MAISFNLDGRTSAEQDELAPGKYLFEILAPSDESKVLSTFNKKDDNGNPIPGLPEMTFVNWMLKVQDCKPPLKVDDCKGQVFFHSTMLWASPEKIAQASRPYFPQDMTIQFMVNAGMGVNTREAGKRISKLNPEHLSKKGELLFDNNVWGKTFWGEIADVTGKDGKVRRQLTKAWTENGGAAAGTGQTDF